MVTAWLARALLAIAVRRWPVSLRDEMRAEWGAELQALASPPQRALMLRFAASLALARPRLGPRVPFFDHELTVGRVARHALLLLLAPAAAVGLSVITPFPIGLVLATVLLLLAALAGAGSPVLRQRAVVLAVVSPAAGVLVVGPLVQPFFGPAWRMPGVTLLWATMLAGTLLLASRFPVRTAVVVAGLGGLAACWVASTIAILPHAAALGLDTSFAHMWYPAHILSPVTVPVGVLPPDPNFCITNDDPCTRYLTANWRLIDFTEGYPEALTIAAAYASAYVLGSASTSGLTNPRPAW